MTALLDVLAQLAQFLAAIAGLAMLVVLLPILARLIPRIPGPERPLRIRPLLIVWPSETPRSWPHINWRDKVQAVAVLLAVGAPGGLYFLIWSPDHDLNRRVAGACTELIGGLALALLCAAWMECLVRFAAMKKRIRFIMLVPAVPLAIYAIACRTVGAPTVDHALFGLAGSIVVWGIVGLVCLICGGVVLYLQGLALGVVWLFFKGVFALHGKFQRRPKGG